MGNELEEHYRQLDYRFYGFTRRQLMKLAFEFTEFKGVSIRFNWLTTEEIDEIVLKEEEMKKQKKQEVERKEEEMKKRAHEERMIKMEEWFGVRYAPRLLTHLGMLKQLFFVFP
uniref:Uncharacterized protein n=1 Tax=Timema cristinae TaxID=61476 RepID=A0A7R9D9S3_TIMCR|nr:unnamed protein product [Timema cristinae]